MERHLGTSLYDVEREHILDTLNICGGNRTKAAAVLSISIRGLRIKLNEYQRCGFAVPPPERSHYENGQGQLALCFH